MRKLLLALLFITPTVQAHDWPADDSAVWATRLTQNHLIILQCVGYVNEDKRKEYKQACDIDDLINEENTLIKEIGTIRNNHVGMSDHEFMTEHFPNPEDDLLYVFHVAENIRQIGHARKALIYLALVDGMYIND